MRDDLTALVERHVVSSLLEQRRLERLVGEGPPWWVDLDANRLEIGGHRFRVDAVGTESRRTGTFVWAWANPGFAELQVMSSALLRGLGERWGIEELTDAGEIPLATLDGDTAGLIAGGESGAAARFVGPHEGGAVVFLLRGGTLASMPLEGSDLAFALTELVTASPRIDQRRAVEEFAAAGAAGFEIASDPAGGLRFEVPGGTVAVRFDDSGRIADVRADLSAAAPARLSEREDDDEPLVVGQLPDGCPYVVLCDPFTLVSGSGVAALPGPLPGSRRDVGVWLTDQPADGARVESGGLLVSEGEPVDWQIVGSVPVDSGVACFGTPEAVERLTAAGEAALESLDALLAANARDTWTHALHGGLVLFSTGYGDDEYDVLFGYDADDHLACVALQCGSPHADESAPGRGRENAFLFPAAAGGEWLAGNIVAVPPAANRAMTRFDRRLLRAAAAGREVVADVLPEYDDASRWPARIRYRMAVGGGAGTDEVLDVAAPRG